MIREESAMNRWVRFAPVAWLVLSVPCLGRADEWKHEYPLTSRPSVVLRATDARIQVGTWGQARVAVRVTTSGWRIRPGEVVVEDRSQGNRVEIEVREPIVHFSLGIEHRRILIEVTVPAGTDLDARTSDGAIELPALQGTIRAHTADGPISLERAKGTFVLSSSDGRIVAHGVDGALDARASDGSITADGRFDSLRLSTSDGRIVADVGPGSRMQTDWSVSTSDGSIDLKLPPDLAANLEAHTGDGHIDVDFPITTQGRIGNHDLRATLHGGGPLLSLRTTDGSIRIEH
jgi:putative adhesin